MGYRGLLLDRDGVVNIDHGYVASREDFTFVEGVLELARHAVDRGYRLVVVTNQSGVARGYYGEDQFHALTRWMAERFAERGGELALVLHCPYHRVGAVARYARESFWRKPNPGMILEAARRLDLDLARSLFVGDQVSDMIAAERAGVGGRVLLADGASKPDEATRVVARLAEVKALLA